jgi:hypothetical protein
MRYLRLFLILMICAGTAQAQSNFTFPTESTTIRFQWESDTSSGRPNPRAAMLIPVKLAGSKKTAYMQFDSGSPQSFFYVNAALSDTSKSLSNYQFTIDKTPAIALHITVKGADAVSQSRIIGTLGTDLFAGKVLIIDYNHQQILIAEQVPALYKDQVTMHDFMFIQNSILLSGIIQGKSKLLYFDTGSSAFELLTDKKSFDGLASTPLKERVYPVKSWQSALTAYTADTKDSVALAGRTIPLMHVTWMDSASDAQVNRMMAMGIGGMIGNQLFIGHILILDTKNKQFGMK